MRRVELFGLPFLAAHGHHQVVAEVLAWPLPPAHADELPLLSTPNVDQVVKLHRPGNAGMLAMIKQARYVLPDGQPIVWTSRWTAGGALPARLAGSDLFPALWKPLAEARRPVFMVLANEAIGQALKKENEAMRWLVPPFYSLEDAAAEQAVAEQLYDELLARPVPLVFLGLGFPKQERLALMVLERLREKGAPVPLFLLLGASFEFHAGLKKRAPRIWQRLGLEFMHRFMSEPRRMFRRYFVEDLAFFRLAWKEVRKR